jgi:hypothetical protein
MIMHFVFDDSHAHELMAELAARLEAFDSFESVPCEIRHVIEEAVAGRGFEFAYLDDGPAFAAGERLVRVKICGDVQNALMALRAMQCDGFVSHDEPPPCQSSDVSGASRGMPFERRPKT